MEWQSQAIIWKIMGSPKNARRGHERSEWWGVFFGVGPKTKRRLKKQARPRDWFASQNLVLGGGQEEIRTPEGRAIWFTARPVWPLRYLPTSMFYYSSLQWLVRHWLQLPQTSFIRHFLKSRAKECWFYIFDLKQKQILNIKSLANIRQSKSGATCRNRTGDNPLTRRALYQLS